MTIEQWWNLLDAHAPLARGEPRVHGGCPEPWCTRSTNVSGGLLRPGPHGEFSLSARDREFIRELAAHGSGQALVAGAGPACAAAEGLALLAAGLEAASSADAGPAVLRSVLEHLLAAQRSVEATLRHLAAVSGQAPQASAGDPGPEGTAADLEEAAVEAERLLGKLAHALGGLPPVSHVASGEGARAG